MSRKWKCEKNPIVHQSVEVNAEITVKPIVKHGNPKVTCHEPEISPGHCCSCGRCKRKESNTGKCTFCVSQILCVEIPLTFEVEVDVEEGISCCGKPQIGRCEPDCDEPDFDHDDD